MAAWFVQPLLTTGKCMRSEAASDYAFSIDTVAFVMELAALLLRDSAELRLDWCPRLRNREADALTNEDFRGFTAKHRIRFCFDDCEGIVLQDMLEYGAAGQKADA